MSIVNWLSPGLSFVGGGLGAALGYRSAAASDRQADRQSRRDEWGRRFTTALEKFISDDDLTHAVGRTMLAHLLDSELASPDDRALARRMLAVESTGSLALRRILTEGEDQGLDFVRDYPPSEEDE